ncbi:hypothetical protein J5F27_13645 [Schleiferilactobacillus harbinensis]|jgi:hypothetical protein|uniref:Uncharacterized protein n=1 Tax=Schleiferilactobacillus harbinensis TaxID=304207 RepID=A0ABU7T2R1_9LACO|nr:hypothetical protein [Schleiferilactobacillus harbinensis]MBO3092951.1 hypothetical protein [Schleiferilactobacillus harbinensis]MCI1686825.1 hypothetical protein [Schleiferilactobacillus harbinensis]MCI1782700.1 hypothetical protein [Schleiferilactobacillus harbinensis]MCI1849644.1 hypothetical protein [Schleiferilactobacillus harbinensis]GEK05667.1 hypothetical protein LHA01_09060 [Schleiferilactobacillus harbinensis]
MKKYINNEAADKQPANPWHNSNFRMLHAAVWGIFIPVLFILKYTLHLF